MESGDPMRKIFFAICILLCCKICFAETCPNVDDIKNNNAKNWIAYDSDDDTRLSPRREADFKKNIVQFTLAEWRNVNNKNSIIHCYYRDTEGSQLEAYLAKPNFIPKNTKNYWYQVSGSMHCAAGKNKCEFQEKIFQNRQLAKK
jgi:hypothetical protein